MNIGEQLAQEIKLAADGIIFGDYIGNGWEKNIR